ncbi:hypothetical protein H9P43_005607 [Blastocladiella emersonii ATCC 22665]|nr:hypothetical protein H9P43_005607 [Blastocladiella emersonii ATCC 22665]
MLSRNDAPSGLPPRGPLKNPSPARLPRSASPFTAAGPAAAPVRRVPSTQPAYPYPHHRPAETGAAFDDAASTTTADSTATGTTAAGRNASAINTTDPDLSLGPLIEIPPYAATPSVAPSAAPSLPSRRSGSSSVGSAASSSGTGSGSGGSLARPSLSGIAANGSGPAAHPVGSNRMARSMIAPPHSSSSSATGLAHPQATQPGMRPVGNGVGPSIRPPSAIHPPSAAGIPPPSRLAGPSSMAASTSSLLRGPGASVPPASRRGSVMSTASDQPRYGSARQHHSHSHPPAPASEDGNHLSSARGSVNAHAHAHAPPAVSGYRSSTTASTLANSASVPNLRMAFSASPAPVSAVPAPNGSTSAASSSLLAARAGALRRGSTLPHPTTAATNGTATLASSSQLGMRASRHSSVSSTSGSERAAAPPRVTPPARRATVGEASRPAPTPSPVATTPDMQRYRGAAPVPTQRSPAQAWTDGAPTPPPPQQPSSPAPAPAALTPDSPTPAASRMRRLSTASSTASVNGTTPVLRNSTSSSSFGSNRTSRAPSVSLASPASGHTITPSMAMAKEALNSYLSTAARIAAQVMQQPVDVEALRNQNLELQLKVLQYETGIAKDHLNLINQNVLLTKRLLELQLELDARDPPPSAASLPPLPASPTVSVASMSSHSTSRNNRSFSGTPLSPAIAPAALDLRRVSTASGGGTFSPSPLPHPRAPSAVPTLADAPARTAVIDAPPPPVPITPPAGALHHHGQGHTADFGFLDDMPDENTPSRKQPPSRPASVAPAPAPVVAIEFPPVPAFEETPATIDDCDDAASDASSDFDANDDDVMGPPIATGGYYGDPEEVAPEPEAEPPHEEGMTSMVGLDRAAWATESLHLTELELVPESPEVRTIGFLADPTTAAATAAGEDAVAAKRRSFNAASAGALSVRLAAVSAGANSGANGSLRRRAMASSMAAQTAPSASTVDAAELPKPPTAAAKTLPNSAVDAAINAPLDPVEAAAHREEIRAVTTTAAARILGTAAPAAAADSAPPTSSSSAKLSVPITAESAFLAPPVHSPGAGIADDSAMFDYFEFDDGNNTMLDQIVLADDEDRILKLGDVDVDADEPEPVAAPEPPAPPAAAPAPAPVHGHAADASMVVIGDESLWGGAGMLFGSAGVDAVGDHSMMLPVLAEEAADHDDDDEDVAGTGAVVIGDVSELVVEDFQGTVPVAQFKAIAGAGMLSELRQWEVLDWDPWNWQTENLATAKVYNGIIIAESLVVLLLNGTVVALAARDPHLRDTAANILFVALCLNNALYGAAIAAERIKLIFEYLWTRTMCTLFAMTNVAFVVTSIVLILFISAERYLTVVRGIYISRQKSYAMVVSSAVMGVGHSLIHTIGGGVGMISRSGIFCYPSQVYSIVGLVDLILLLGNTSAIAFGYLSVLAKIQESYKSVKRITNVPQFGAATMQSLETAANESAEKRSSPNTGHGILASVRLGRVSVSPTTTDHETSATTGTASAHGSNPTLAAPSILLPRASSASLLSNSPTTPSMSALPMSPMSPMSPTTDLLPQFPDPQASSGLKKRPIRKVRSVQAEQKRRTEIRVLRRGMLSFLASWFTLVPFGAMIIDGFFYGKRISLELDTFSVVIKLLSEMCDAIILLTLDRHFNRALRRAVGLKQP